MGVHMWVLVEILVPELCDNSCLHWGPHHTAFMLGTSLHIKEILRKSTFLVVLTLARTFKAWLGRAAAAAAATAAIHSTANHPPFVLLSLAVVKTSCLVWGRGVTYDHRMRSLTTTDTCQGFWVTYDHKVRSLTTTEPHIHWQGQQNLHSAWGHLWPQNAVTYDHKTLSQQNNRRGWGGWDDNVPWLAHRHAERWSGLPALGLHTRWPILVGGGGVGGMITYHKALLQYYSALQNTTLHYKVLLRTTKYY